MESKAFDVIVIGAGVMGSSTSYQMAKRGQKTLLLEQFDFLHHRGSSHGESRTSRATYPEDYYSRMVLESSKLWEEAESEIGYKVYYKTSQFDMGPSDDNSLLAVVGSCQKNCIPYRVFNHCQVLEEFSGKFKIPEDWIGVSTQNGGVIKPTKAVAMFQALAIKYGATLKDNMEVTDIKKDDTRGTILVCTKSGEKFWCKKCAITVGAWMKKLVHSVSGQILPIQPVETVVCYWKIKDEYEADFTIEESKFPTFASYGEPYIYGTPSLEFPGMIKIAIHGGSPCDPNKRTWTTKPMLMDSLKQWIQTTFSGLVDSSRPVMMQSCIYSMTPDEDFVIDFLGGEFGKDVVVGGGFSGHGFKMAPAVGRIMADLLLSGDAKGVELKYFRLGRFEDNAKGNAKEYDVQVMLTEICD